MIASLEEEKYEMEVIYAYAESQRFELDCTKEPVKENADKTELEQLIAEAEEIDLTGYTAESVELFQSAFKTAQTVLADESLSKDDQHVVDEAVALLKKAIEGLTPDESTPDPTDPPHTHEFGEWVVTKEPTSTTEGEETRTCSCGKTETRSIPKLSNPFDDVSSDDYYFEPVLWAAYKNITAGVSDGKFGPEVACTRGQLATLLWASAGRPEPKSTNNPFKDVNEDDYYKAVLWAVENGITAGMSAGRFGPNVVCNRAQTVTFLWAAEGKPVVESGISFSDVTADDYYYDAVKWAVDNDITAGMSDDKFGPNEDCTRG